MAVSLGTDCNASIVIANLPGVALAGAYFSE